MTYLDETKRRLEDAQQRMQAATHRLQLAQYEHQSVASEVASYQKIIEVEARKAHRETAVATLGAVRAASASALASVIASSPSDNSDSNKTETIRQLLRDHPAGLTPAQIWHTLKGQMNHRNYVYSVLKRLKDRKQVSERRGKYYFQEAPKSEGAVGGAVQ